jgi:hypothetical protein
MPTSPRRRCLLAFLPVAVGAVVVAAAAVVLVAVAAVVVVAAAVGEGWVMEMAAATVEEMGEPVAVDQEALAAEVEVSEPADGRLSRRCRRCCRCRGSCCS